MAPRHQDVAIVSSVAEFEIADGTKRRLHSGNGLMAKYLSGHGHIAHSIGGEVTTPLAISLAESSQAGVLKRSSAGH